jgi:hypothetical protein
LIRALRGATPFDGSRFPPFMWGGRRVADCGIDFIAEWIDDGCPADDRGGTPLGSRRRPMRLEITTHPVARAEVKDLELDVVQPGLRPYAYPGFAVTGQTP